MEEKFINLFREALEMEDKEVNLTDNFRQYEEWSSLAYLSVIAMIDEEFDVQIEGKDFKELKTVGDLINAIIERKQEA